MHLSVSAARRHLGALVTRAQDPREVIVLTRHGQPIAALVSIPEVERIWRLQEDAWMGRPSALTGRRRGRALVMARELIMGPEGKPVSRREAAEIIQSRQMTRAEERAMLQAGGLDPVEGGEVATLDRPEPPSVEDVLEFVEVEAEHEELLPERYRGRNERLDRGYS